jgi:hypothetical protein
MDEKDETRRGLPGAAASLREGMGRRLESSEMKQKIGHTESIDENDKTRPVIGVIASREG